MCGLLRIQVDRPIHFNRQSFLDTVKVENDLPNGMLTPEFKARHLLVAQHPTTEFVQRRWLLCATIGLDAR